jgi:transcription elongation factor GreB
VSRRSMNPRLPQGPTKSASGSTTCYITPRGHRMLTDELERLWKVERPKVTQEVADAAAQGDRSENAEYLYGKKKLREIDRRIRFLSKRIDELQVVRPSPKQRGRVFFGAHVTIESEEGEESRFQIVGPDEYDTALSRISVDSPMARALIGKREGDEVRVERPRGTTTVTIVEIDYDLPER